MFKVGVQLVVWNGRVHLAEAIASLARQTFRDFELMILDNGSDDDSYEESEKLLKNFSLPHRLYRSEKNLGFAGGHNFLFAKTESEYVFCVNQDISLAPDYLEKIIAALDSDGRIASSAGLLLGENGTVDSSGLVRTWYGKFFDLKEKGKGIKNVFGVSGALPVYRRSAVLSVSSDGALFDESFFSYKEDVDLAWRLALGGFTACTVFDAVAFHVRSFGEAAKGDPKFAWRQRLSARNHLLTLVKDLPVGEFWKMPAICFYEALKAVYLAFFMPAAVGYIGEFFARLPNALKERKVFWSRLKANKNERF